MERVAVDRIRQALNEDVVAGVLRIRGTLPNGDGMHRRQSTALPNQDVIRRLERIEQIVDSTAVEVERLAESNRFVAKLLAERSGAERTQTHS